MKQVIILRTDLGMRRGKEVAQGAHASLKAVLDNATHLYVQKWKESGFTKIVVGVDSEAGLIQLYNEAVKSKLPAALIRDEGRTEFNGIPTLTAVAIGPGPVEIVDKITGQLKLR